MRFRLRVPNDPQQVFAAIADFSRLKDWDPMVAESTLISGDPMELGARYRLRTPRGMQLEYSIIEVDAPTRIVYRGGTRRVTSTDIIEVGAFGDGSELSVESLLEFTGWTTLVAPLILAGVWLAGRLRSLGGMRRHLHALRSGGPV